MRHYVAVRTRDAHAADRDRGFTVQGFSTDSSTLAHGDRLAIYVGKPLSGFVATTEVVGERFVSHDRIWTVSKRPDEVFPFRYPTQPRVVAAEGNVVPFSDLIDELALSAHLRNKRLWGMLFIRAIRSLTPSDFDLIEGRLRHLADAAD